METAQPPPASSWCEARGVLGPVVSGVYVSGVGELHCAVWVWVWGSDWPSDDLSEDQFLATTATTAATFLRG